MMRHRFTLFSKMLLADLCVILCMAAMWAIFYVLVVDALRAEGARYARQIASQAASGVDTLVGDIDRMSLACASDETLLRVLRAEDSGESSPKDRIEGYQAIRDQLYTISSYRPFVAGFTVFALTGEFYYTGQRSPRYGYDFRKDAWYEELGDRSSLVLPTRSQSQVVAGTEAQVVSVARKLIDPRDFRILGYVLVDLDVEAFQSIMLGRGESASSLVAIMTPSGRIVYSNESARSPILDELSRLEARFAAADGSLAVRTSRGGYLLTYATSTRTGWYVVVGVPEASFSGALVRLNRFALLITSLTLLLSVSLSMWLSKRLTKPLAELGRAMLQVERGDLDAAIEARSNDEIGELGRGFNRMIDETKRLIARAVGAEVAGREARLQALQAQINPHFLYNTLAVIDGIASVHRIKEINTVSGALAAILRYAVSEGDFAPLSLELEHVRSYISIQEIRLYGTLSSSLSCEEEASGCRVPKLILQPLVENAILHGCAGVKVGAELAVRAAIEGGRLVVDVMDNGKGIEPGAAEAKPASIGLRNVRERLRVQYGDARASLEVSPRPEGGTLARLLLPVERMEGP